MPSRFIDPCSCQSDCLVWSGRRTTRIIGLPRLVGIDGVSRTKILHGAHRSQSGGNFKTWQRISTPGHAFDDGRK
ncbi:hypothetical protein TNCV_61431 [Trichonephila clavipes]|nr:hypothetical protein TNCV_61431 [Trichonephila clavipes]